MRSAQALLLTAAISGCGIFTSPDCTLLAAPAITLAIGDAQTGVAPTVVSTITVTDGAFVETYPRPDSPAVVADWYTFALERTGKYTIVIRTPGYSTWTKANVSVGLSGCHVDTATITAKLVR